MLNNIRIFFIFCLSFQQLFAGNMKGSYIQMAYWYNIPTSKEVILNLDNDKLIFGSTLQIYGKILSTPFKLKAKVLDTYKAVVFEKIFEISKTNIQDSTYKLIINNNSFKIICPVPFLTKYPNKIVLSINKKNLNESKEFTCKYHTLSGSITDFKGSPLQAFLCLQLDGFENEDLKTGIWSDKNGNYEIKLPDRTYSSLYVNTVNYGIDILEAWGWNIIIDEDQNLNFKIGKGEIYNMQAWKNNGGGKTLFISIRPMILLPQNAKEKKNFIKINNKKFELIDYSPELSINNLCVFVDNIKVDIISLQKYYETDNTEVALPAYLILVNMDELLKKVEKQTIMVEFSYKSESDKCIYNGMCYFQNYLKLPYYDFTLLY